MERRQYITLGLIFFFFLAALAFDEFIQNSTNLNNYTLNIQQYLQQQEADIEELFAQEDFMKRQFVASTLTSANNYPEDVDKLKPIAKEKYTVFFFNGDSLVLWTNNKVSIEGDVLKETKGKNGNKFRNLDNGYYELIYRTYEVDSSKYQTAIAAIPIKYNYILESHHLSNQFVENKDIPQSVNPIIEPTEYPIKRIDGTTLAYLSAPSKIKDKKQQFILLIMYLMGFVCIGFLTNDLSKIIAKRYRLWAGAGFLIFMVFGVRYWTIYLDITQSFSDLHLFSRTFDTPVLNSSLGDLLINIVLLLWMMVFFHREFTVKNIVNMSTPLRYGLTILNFFSIILGLLMVTGVFKSLVIESGINFNFNNVFKMNTYSILALIGVLLLLFALFLFTHRMMLTIQKINLSRPHRVICFLAAMGSAMPLLYESELYFHPFIFAAFAFLYYVTFDIFTFLREHANIWWALWLFLFASYSTALLRKYNNEKDIQTQLEYAKELAVWQDTLAEKGFIELQDLLLQDTALARQAITPIDLEINDRAFDRVIDKYYTQNNYLFNNYNYKYLYYTDNFNVDLIHNVDISSALDYFKEVRKDSMIQRTNHQNLEYIIDQKENTLSYVLPITLVNDEHDKRILLMEFSRKRREPSKVYTELLLDFQYKDLENLNYYDYAIYRGGKLIEESSRSHDPELIKENLPPSGKFKKKLEDNRNEIIYHATNGTVVMMGRDLGGLLKLGSLFSYLFVLLIVALGILILVNSITNALPNATKFAWKRPSFRNLIQISTFSLIFISFVGIAGVTVYYFHTSSETYHENRLERKLRSVITHAEATLTQLEKEDEKITVEKLPEILAPFSEIHRMDLNIYKLDGTLQASSEEDIFKKGIISPKMNPLALHDLAVDGLSKTIYKEDIGELNYKAAYVPLQVPNGKRLAYIGLPYYSKQRKLNSDVSDFMGTILNVYVLIFVISGMLAAFIANLITQPIANIGQKIRSFKLNKHNEKLHYRHKDEIGELVAQFNEMIDTTVESAKKLADTERDLAWREMAKQVAHEIKNPMTPMRLQIEFFKMKFKQAPEQALSSFNRMADSLIEQIDTLTNIATEFSNFAKMPQAKNDDINLNDLITKVHQIFSQEEQKDFKVNLVIPDDQYLIYADREQVLRVFNNLIKNAIQAIPDGRFGIINIKMFEKENNKITLQIQDNGTGIPEEMRKKVFLFNFTTKSSGTGLGLAMSKKIIEQANGKIYFDTHPDVGTSFFVELPIKETFEETTPIVLDQLPMTVFDDKV